MSDDWRMTAACRDMDVMIFYPVRGDIEGLARARAICADCPVRVDCLDDAIATKEDDGIRGGMSGKQRRQERARRNKFQARDLERIASKIVAILRPGPLSKAEIQGAVGLGERATRDALDLLRERGVVALSGRSKAARWHLTSDLQLRCRWCSEWLLPARVGDGMPFCGPRCERASNEYHDRVKESA